MIFNIITLFPESFNSMLESSILKRAKNKKLITFNFINPRDFTTDKYKTVDDKPYGGGPGMVMKVEPIVKALKTVPKNSHKILLTASGQSYNQKIAAKLSQMTNITLICGHYEGVDARVEKHVDSQLSIGNYVLTGGEIAALNIIDSVSRLIPGVIRDESSKSESFEENLLEAPQYTRPEEFEGQKVPEVLLKGNHKEIENWRAEESKKRTKKFRPDLEKS